MQKETLSTVLLSEPFAVFLHKLYNFDICSSSDQGICCRSHFPRLSISFPYSFSSVNYPIKQNILVLTRLSFKHEKDSQESKVQQKPVQSDPITIHYIRGKCRHLLFFVRHY